mmetsp:Transcript_10116/g.17618  ORF Transcript_10116/g.17618 Transcript_10116/m.17618 type:complete len:203 (-) Transcript_10116:76-684(-)
MYIPLTAPSNDFQNGVLLVHGANRIVGIRQQQHAHRVACSCCVICSCRQLLTHKLRLVAELKQHRVTCIANLQIIDECRVDRGGQETALAWTTQRVEQEVQGSPHTRNHGYILWLDGDALAPRALHHVGGGRPGLGCPPEGRRIAELVHGHSLYRLTEPFMKQVHGEFVLSYRADDVAFWVRRTPWTCLGCPKCSTIAQSRE